MQKHASSLPRLMIISHIHFNYNFIAWSKINLLLIQHDLFYQDHTSKQLFIANKLFICASIIIIIKILIHEFQHVINQLFFFFFHVPIVLYFFQCLYQHLHSLFFILVILFTQFHVPNLHSRHTNGMQMLCFPYQSYLFFLHNGLFLLRTLSFLLRYLK